MKRLIAFATLVCAVTASTAQAQPVLVYDAISDQTAGTTTGTNPHTYMGQGFSMSNAAGNTPMITGFRIGEFVIASAAAPVNYGLVRGRVQFWGTYDTTATGTAIVFSNPIGGPVVFTANPIVNQTANTVTFYTVNLGAPINFPGITNLGISVNWQGSNDGGTTWLDDNALATSMRTPVATTPIPIGTNVTVAGQYFRNQSGLTNFTFQAGDSRSIGGTNATDGLEFSLTAVVPEPTSFVLMGLVGAAGIGWRRRRMS